LAGHIVFDESTDTIGVMRGSLLVLIAVCLLPVGALAAADVVSTWNGTTGNWTDFARWSSDPLYPNNGNGGFTYDAVINNGSVTQDLAAGITIEKLALGGGMIAGDYDLMVNGLFTWTGGTMSGTGTVHANGGMTIGGSALKTLTGEARLENAGVATWSGAGNIRTDNGWGPIVIDNLLGATFDIQNDSEMLAYNVSSGWPVFNNAGVLRKSAGTGETHLEMIVNNTGTVEVQTGTLRLSGTFGQTEGETVVQRLGTVMARQFSANKVINNGMIVSTGSMTIGDAATYDGYSGTGSVDAGSRTITFRSAGFTNLGYLTTLSAGNINASNGLALGTGANLVGSGTVNAKIAAGFGSTVRATGNLSVGDSTSYAGFFSDGELYTEAHTVTVKDKNTAVLGSLTQLGDGASQGTLTAGNADPGDTYSHFLLEQGKNMVGRGYVEGHYKNHGDVIGDGTAMAERLIFNSPWIVTGKGTFTRTLILGTFAPGDSPTITNGTDQAFGGTVEIELGGTTPGSGDDNHDQINDTGTILLAGSPTLEILPWNSFVPDLGDEFMVLTWQTGLDGTFGSVETDSWYTDRGVAFELHYSNVTGVGNLTLEAVPEPATLALLALGGIALIARRRRSSRAP